MHSFFLCLVKKVINVLSDINSIYIIFWIIFLCCIWKIYCVGKFACVFTTENLKFSLSYVSFSTLIFQSFKLHWFYIKLNFYRNEPCDIERLLESFLNVCNVNAHVVHQPLINSIMVPNEFFVVYLTSLIFFTSPLFLFWGNSCM